VNVNVSGTPRAPIFDGTLSVANGSATVVALGVPITGITANLSGRKTATGADSIKLDGLHAVTLATDGKPSGRIDASGWVKNLVVKGSPPSFLLNVTANNFHAYNKRSVAEVFVTTTTPLLLRGNVLASTLAGALYVDHGSIFLADRDIARKQSVQFISDAILNPANADAGARWSTLMTNLNPLVTITLGNDVRLRSKEANVKLNGSLSLQTSTDRSTRKLASSGELVPVPSLEGVLRTESGTYNLNLGLVQREFTVQPDGTVTFSGAADNPTLDIRAKYDVKQARDRDLGVIVHLYGPLLPNPVIEFGSTADYDIAQSDLLSYLITGKPGFDFAANPGSSQILASFLGPTLSALAADKLRNQLGSFVDAFQFQFGAYGQEDNATKNFTNALYGATIAAEKRYGNNVFLSVNTGLCPFNPDVAGGRSALTALTGLGAKVELRIRPEFAIQTAYDPPTASRNCGAGVTGIGFVSTPQVFSFSLSHSWRF
jgi:autotransporter translocation and assembly factor TamB